MTFEEILDQAIDMLRRRGRLTYGALKRQFNLDDAYLEDLKEELIEGQRLAVDEQGKVLVWIGEREPVAALAPAALPATVPILDPTRGPVSYTPPHLIEKILTSRSALEGERKQVSVLFCDLANSTALAERLGPEAMHGLLNRFFALALEAVHRYEGTINQFLGDGFMALFGAPLTHEDHARRAVLAALGLQRTLQEQHAALGGLYGVECTVRVGLNSGLVVVGGIGDNLRMDYTAIGDTTNLAARLQQVADPGAVLISAATRQLVQGYAQLEALPPLQLKGITAPVTAFRVVGLSRRRSPIALRGERSLSQFVGRSRELATLEALLARVEAGEGQVVGVVGEAGAGKSRLLFEFRQCLRDRPVTYLEGRCLSYGRAIPYVPLLDLLRHNCGITDTETPETLTAKVGTSLREVGMDAEEWAPYLLHLFGVQAGTERLGVLSPEAIKARTFELVRQMSLNGSQRRPLIFEVEDLHWMDTTSEAFFALLAESLNAARLLVLGTYRPGYRPPWLEQSNATQIALQRLTLADGLVVIRSLAPPERLSEPMAQTILAKAEGNPFFLEELTRTVLDAGESQAAMVVPDTVQGVLMARIDRLPEMAKRLLQTASVLGREFSLRLLSAIWTESGGLAPLLLELKRLEFVYEQTGAEELTYVFKHALTQDVAYESLLMARRQSLHAAAGMALERLYATRLEDVYDRLAYHYAKTDETDKAVDYLMRFAEKAARSYAHADAVTALQEALVHVARLPVEARDRRTLELTLRLVNSLYFLGRFQETLDVLLQQRECLERLQAPTLAGPYYFWLSHTYSYRREAALAAQSAQHAIAAAQQCGDEVTLGKAYYMLAREGFWMCQYPQGVEQGRQAITLLEQTEERWWLGQSYWAVGLNYTFMGECAPAMEAVTRAHTIGETIGNTRLQTYAMWAIGWVAATRGDWQEGVAACQRSLEQSVDPINTACALGWMGYAYLEHGDAGQAIPMLERAIEGCIQVQYHGLQGWFTAWLSDAYLVNHQREQAHTTALQGLDIARDVKNGYTVGWTTRVLGRIAQARGAFAEATSHLQEALETFASIQSRLEVGRTHLDLAALAYAQNHLEATAAHCQAAHAVFTALHLPMYVERAAQRASEYGVVLAALAQEQVEGQ